MLTTWHTLCLTPGRRLVQGPSFDSMKAAWDHTVEHANDGAWTVQQISTLITNYPDIPLYLRGNELTAVPSSSPREERK